MIPEIPQLRFIYSVYEGDNKIASFRTRKSAESHAFKLQFVDKTGKKYKIKCEKVE